MREFWRAAATPLVLLALLAVLILGGYWGYQNVIKPIPAKAPQPCVTQNVGTALTPKAVTVRVYNGGRTGGLAGKVGAALKAKGFKVPVTTNTDERVRSTIILGGKADNPEVLLVAAHFLKATIRADKRVDGTVDVLVGTEFGGMAAKPPSSVPLPSGTACLPSPTPKSAAKPAAKPAAAASTPKR